MRKNSSFDSDLSPRALPSPLPNTSQNSVKPSVPDVSVMENEASNDPREFYFGFLDQLLKNDRSNSEFNEDESQNSIEIPRRDEGRLKSSESFDWSILCSNKSTRRKSVPTLNTNDFDDVFLPDNHDQNSRTSCPIQWNLDDLPCASSTPSSYQIKSFRVDQFSPIFEEPSDENLIENITSHPFFRSKKTSEVKNDSRTTSKNYALNKQKYHRDDMSIRMNELAEKYLPKNAKGKENIRLKPTTNDLKYSITSEKHLARYGLLPKDYKMKENKDQTQPDFSIATKQYIKKHKILQNHSKDPKFDQFSLQINSLANRKIFD